MIEACSMLVAHIFLLEDGGCVFLRKGPFHRILRYHIPEDMAVRPTKAEHETFNASSDSLTETLYPANYYRRMR
jgi:hypothetical protein